MSWVGEVPAKHIVSPNPENLHGRRHDELLLNLDPLFHVVVIVICVVFEVAALTEVTLLGAAGHLATVFLACLVDNQLLSILVEDREVNILVAEE